MRTIIAPAEPFAAWRDRVRAAVQEQVRSFVAARCAEYCADTDDAEVLGGLLAGYVGRGKLIRSTLALAGWQTVAEESAAAVRAAAALELLHCFALLQDDVMDGSPLRRGAPSAHVTFARWHRANGLSGSAERFGESAAVLAGDLCLVWAGQMVRESGVDHVSLARVWPRYDRMLSTLAVGQFRDLVNESRRTPSFRDVRDVARAKSGDYSVRAPLQLGADLAGGPAALLDGLGRFGDAVGEAFQFRDDVLGAFGSPQATGKPAGDDVRARKATCLVVLAKERADAATRRELVRLDAAPELGERDVDRYLDIIETTGARAAVERLIDDRLAEGLAVLDSTAMPAHARDRLAALARACAERAQ